MNRTKLEQAKERLNALLKEQSEILGENKDEFKEVAKKLSVKEVEEASDEKIMEINRSCSTGTFIGEPEFENEVELVGYLREILKFLVQTYEYAEAMDAKVAELNEIMKETDKILKEAVGVSEDANAIETISAAIDRGLEKAKAAGEEDKIKSIEKSKATFLESFRLTRLKELYKTLDPNNLKEDAKSSRSLNIYKKYVKVQQHLGSRYDLTNVVDLEVKFLPEEYHELNNLFIIACIKYISKLMDNRTYSSDDALFVSQLSTNLFMLDKGTLPLEYKETLLSNIREFLDLLK